MHLEQYKVLRHGKLKMYGMIPEVEVDLDGTEFKHLSQQRQSVDNYSEIIEEWLNVCEECSNNPHERQ